jgi:hypothetical protein
MLWQHFEAIHQPPSARRGLVAAPAALPETLLDWLAASSTSCGLLDGCELLLVSFWFFARYF